MKNSWTGNFNIPRELKKQYGDHLASAEGPVSIGGKGNLTITFRYTGGDGGNNKLNLAGVQLLSAQGAVLDSDFHPGATGDSSTSNTYKVKVPARGGYMLRYWAETKTEPDRQQGGNHFLPARNHRGEGRRPAGGLPNGARRLEPQDNPPAQGNLERILRYRSLRPRGSSAGPSSRTWNGSAPCPTAPSSITTPGMS